MTLLERVSTLLSHHGIPHALIGAAALAVHGVSRSTIDQDLLVYDRRVLEPDFWGRPAGVEAIDIRRGESDDPLAGVVRIGEEADRVVDVVVGRHKWQEDIVRRAIAIGGLQPPVAQRADLVLLKLYAGGNQDRWDIAQLLAGDAGTDTVAVVDARIEPLPTSCRELWSMLRSQA